MAHPGRKSFGLDKRLLDAQVFQSTNLAGSAMTRLWEFLWNEDSKVCLYLLAGTTFESI